MSTLRIPFLLVTGLLLAAAAHAAPPAKAFGTREQLRDCLAVDDALRARWHAIELATADHNRKFDANDAEDAELVKMKAGLDRSDKSAISAFNKAVQGHGQHIQQVNQEAADEEVTARAYAADRAAADDRCASLTYRPADIDAVSKERKKAAAAAAASASAP
jgi:nucleoside-diphosphate-sugar epimerase